MKHLSLFTGAGGGEYAAILLGLETVAYVENNAHCRAVIARRQLDGIFPRGPIYGDIREFDGRPWRGRADVITGGFPCQPFSVAGKGRGADDERNMWPEFARIIREVEPGIVFMENSPALLDSRGGFYVSTILGDLAACGFDAAWTVLGAASAGAPHQRDRWWCLAAHPDRVRLWQEQERESWSARTSVAPSDGTQGVIAHPGCFGEPQPEEGRDKARGWAADGSPEIADAHMSGRKEQRFAFAGEPEQPASKLGNWWSTEPDVMRVAHGVANRSKRLRALGNGQVPVVAALAFMGLYSRIMTAWEAGL